MAWGWRRAGAQAAIHPHTHTLHAFNFYITVSASLPVFHLHSARALVLSLTHYEEYMSWENEV